MANSEKRIKSGSTCYIIAFLFLLSPISSADKTTVHRNDWYLSQSDESATIQMSGYESEEGAIASISALNLPGDVGYYQTRYKNKPWFAVTYGLFDSLAEARSHLKSLPANIQKSSPWPRSFKVIRSLITVAKRAASSDTPADGSAKKESPLPTWIQGQAAYEEGDHIKAFEVWQILAKNGDELSQFNLGVLYSRGDGINQNIDKALEWYMRSAEQGYAPAQFNLGTAYLEGKPDSTEVKKAVSWWRKAAQQGFVPAQFNLAGLYCQGSVISKNMDRCKFWYKRAASNGDMNARKVLDQILKTEKNGKPNTGVQQTVSGDRGNKVQPVAINRKLTSQEQVQLRRAQSAFTRNKYMKSHNIWLPLAESGIAEAQYSLGFLYQSGWGPERDLQKAAAWYLNAAEQNEARAQFNLGVILLSGEDDIEKDSESGLLWLTRSANSNNARAKEFLINIYSKGEYGIEVSREKADYWKSH